MRSVKKLNNQELLELLKKDVNAFNDYRENYPNQIIDFCNANLSENNLAGSNISNCNFTRCYLSNSDLRNVKAKGACFKYAEAEHCDFRGSDVESANFDYSILHGSDFRGSNILKSNISLDDHYIKTSSQEDEIDLYRQYENGYYVPKESVLKTMIRHKTHKLTIEVDPEVYIKWSRENTRRFQEKIEKDLDNKLNEKKYFYPFYLYFICCFTYFFWWILK
tara:strand:+ start:2726 stop:3388 length:663 start_codon:yes stop_codon:yes gene_type:complete